MEKHICSAQEQQKTLTKFIILVLRSSTKLRIDFIGKPPNISILIMSKKNQESRIAKSKNPGRQLLLFLNNRSFVHAAGDNKQDELLP